MSQKKTEAIIRRAMTVPVPAGRAFAVFTEKLAAWWPREYTWAKDTLDTIGLEPREGGRCFERGPHGFTCDWGRVLAWNPPRQVVFLWQISPARVPEPDPQKASEVEVRFEAEGPQATRVAFEHRGFAKHGAGSTEYRAAMDAAQGWDYILGRYAEAAARG